MKDPERKGFPALDTARATRKGPGKSQIISSQPLALIVLPLKDYMVLAPGAISRVEKPAGRAHPALVRLSPYAVIPSPRLITNKLAHMF